MMNIEDKDIRRALMERYLEAETTVSEEIALAQWFAAHATGPDEAAVAKLISLGHPSVEALSEEGGADFDRIVSNQRAAERRKPIRHAIIYAAGIAAAGLLLLVLHTTVPKTPDFTPLEIAEEMNALMSIGMEEIESISAKPSGRNILITAYLKDGSSSTFLMSRNPETGGLQLLSMEKMNNKQLK